MSQGRIRPAPSAGNPPDVQALIDAASATVGGGSNLLLTLARHPGLFRRWGPFSGKLLSGGKLPPCDREMAILRTAHRCGSDYEWVHHRRLARQAGVTDEEAQLLCVEGTGGWPAADAALVRACDQLVRDHMIDDITWNVLTGRYDDQQLIELTMVVGNWAMLSGTLNSLGVRLEQEETT